MRTRYSMLLAAAAMALGFSPGLPTISAQAETVVRYGISMADIPLTTGQPDRGAGAYQFSAYTIYDPLVAWEMDVSDRPGKLVPGLATEWKVDEGFVDGARIGRFGRFSETLPPCTSSAKKKKTSGSDQTGSNCFCRKACRLNA